MKFIIPLTAIFFITSYALAADDAALISNGDRLDAHFQNRAALQLFLKADQTTPHKAEILRRIAKQYSEMIVSASSDAEKRALAEKAVDYSKRAIAADPQNAMSHLSLAISYGKLSALSGNREKVEDSRLVRSESLKTLELDPKNDWAYYMLGRWNDAVANMNPVVSAIVRVVYGGLPQASNEEAEKDFRKAIALAPQHVLYHIGLAKTLEKLGKKDEARKEFETALKLPSVQREDADAKADARKALKES